MKVRCAWCTEDTLYQKYHDTEWGVPVYDDQKLFEFLVLEGAQAGLSWVTVLRKREAYRAAFLNFDYQKIAAFGQAEMDSLMANAGIIRNKRKIFSAVQNAKGYLKVIEEFGSFSQFIWRYVDGQPVINHWQKIREVPAETKLSQLISKDLKKRGFNFVGPTICYSFMQAVGMVNDHTVDCFRYTELT